MPGTSGLENQLEVGEFIILDGLGIEGNEQRPLFTPNRPVRLEGMTDLRLFLRFGRPWGPLEHYYIVHVISATIEMEMKAWPLVPAAVAFALVLIEWNNLWPSTILLAISMVCVLGFFRMRRVLAITVVGGREFRFAGDLPGLERVADKMRLQISRRDAHSETVYKAPPPIVFPPRAVPPPQVVKETARNLPSMRKAPPPAPPARPGRDFKYCHMCGQRLQRVSRFCPECGERQ